VTDPHPGARRARAMLLVGVVLFWSAQLGLLLVVGMPLLDTIALAVLLVLIPSLSLAQLPLVDGAEIDRMPAYWGSIATLWFLGTAAWLVGTRDGGAAAVGLTPLGPVAFLGWTALLTAAALAIIVAFRQAALWSGARDTPLLRELLPRTARERATFGLLSIAAGAGEEIAYRGYAMTALAPLTGLTAAAVLTSAVFGAAHAYQGLLGVLRTALMGGVLAWGYIASGSLWPAIVAHTIIDVLAGIVLGERLLLPPDEDPWK